MHAHTIYEGRKSPQKYFFGQPKIFNIEDMVALEPLYSDMVHRAYKQPPSGRRRLTQISRTSMFTGQRSRKSVFTGVRSQESVLLIQRKFNNNIWHFVMHIETLAYRVHVVKEG